MDVSCLTAKRNRLINCSLCAYCMISVTVLVIKTVHLTTKLCSSLMFWLHYPYKCLNRNYTPMFTEGKTLNCLALSQWFSVTFCHGYNCLKDMYENTNIYIFTCHSILVICTFLNAFILKSYWADDLRSIWLHYNVRYNGIVRQPKICR